MADRTYFVTIRLSGTLPQRIVAELLVERETLIATGCNNDERWMNLHRAQFLKIEGILDSLTEYNDCSLIQPEVANTVMKSFEWLADDAGWRIYAATIMPTHLHIVIRNDAGRSGELINDLAKFKRFTGKAANRILKRSGRFWAREDFDHWCRTPEKAEAAVRYVHQNPVKAGFVSKWQNWDWTI